MATTVRYSMLIMLVGATVVGAGCSGGETASTNPIIVVETAPETTLETDVTSSQAPESTSASTEAASDPGAASSDEQKLAEFSQCMRDNGVAAFEDPTVQADGSVNMFDDATQAAEVTSDPEFNAAYEACINLLEGASFITNESEAEAEDNLVKLAACLRDRGIEVDDPNFDAENPDDVFGAELDPNDPAVNQAVAECSQEVYTDTSEGQ